MYFSRTRVINAYPSYYQEHRPFCCLSNALIAVRHQAAKDFLGSAYSVYGSGHSAKHCNSNFTSRSLSIISRLPDRVDRETLHETGIPGIRFLNQKTHLANLQPPEYFLLSR